MDELAPLPTFGAVVVAAGSGTRFGGPKHGQHLDGIPFWKRCTDVLAAAGIDEIVVVGDVPGGIAGGDRRRDSVAIGLRALPDTDWVLIHDAARPLLTAGLVASVMAAATSTDADGIVPTVPVTDTIKRVSDDRVVETVDRATLAAAQTPQCFRTAVLLNAHASISGEATDDANLVERAGGIVRTVSGDPENIKVTYRTDLERAQAIIDRRNA